jgi:hypothetical protein
LLPLPWLFDKGMKFAYQRRPPALLRALRTQAKGTSGELTMAVNKPIGDNARKGAVKKRSQTKTPLEGASAWTKRDRTSGEFMG